MDIYLAGGIQGNCKPLWIKLIKAWRDNKMHIYLAGLNGRRWIVDLYLTEQAPWKQEGIYDKTIQTGVKILESFYYADEWTEWVIPRLKNFMLDSGAFTFMTSHKGKVDWNDYLRKYAEFINKNDVKLFFELDIDSIVGYDKVLEMRRWLESATGKKPIPVWHKSRGKEEFLKMCEEYDYVAIGGIVSKEITRQEYKFFPWFIKEAHKRGAKIHGLGFTNLEGIRKYHFDSVDSTSWTTGNRFGAVYKFNGRTMEKQKRQENQRLKNPKEVAIHNFNEWVKFSHYAEKYL